MLRLNTNNFSWHSDIKKFLAEASDLAGNLRHIPEMFELESGSTGNVIRMYRYFVEKDNEGEILNWQFHPEGDFVRWTLVIFND